MKNAVFWDVTLCGSYKNRRFVGTYRIHHQDDRNRRARNNASGMWQPKYDGKLLFLRSVFEVATYCKHFPYFSDSFYPDVGGDVFLRNVGSGKSHMASHSRRLFFMVTALKT
jgi:hypothetical protein